MDSTCGSALEEYVGADPEGLGIGGYYPDNVGCSYGRRSIICITSRDDGAELEASVRDSGGLSS